MFQTTGTLSARFFNLLQIIEEFAMDNTYTLKRWVYLKGFPSLCSFFLGSVTPHSLLGRV
jgi:hypothetical protein